MQSGRVQLEQPDVDLACNPSNMDEVVFSYATIDETQQLIQIPQADI